MYQIVQANNLHRWKLFELFPINVELSDILQLLFLFRLGNNLLNRLVEYVVCVAVHHIAFALIIAILGKYVLVVWLADWSLSLSISVQFKEVWTGLPRLLGVLVWAYLTLFQDVVHALHEALFEDFLLLLALLMHAILLFFDYEFFFVLVVVLFLQVLDFLNVCGNF